MAKAAVELPDPLDTSTDGGKPLTSTDDLLAQLAGEEIDRLLAEVEEHSATMEPLVRPPAPPMTLPPRVAPAARAVPDAPAEVDEASTPAPPGAVTLPAEPVVTPPAPDEAADESAGAAAVASAGPDVTAELDAFFRTAVVKAPAEAAPAAAARPPEPHETSAAERAVLHAAVAAPPAAPASDSPAAVHPPAPAPEAGAVAPDADDAPLPLYLRPLEWINAPLEACPQGLRDFIGKAAIITLVNAAAVLCYVMLFRRR